MAIRKRKPATSKYVFTDEAGVLNVRVPGVCVNWNEEFRKRLSSDWLAPRRIMNREVFLQEYVNNGWSDKVYNIDGHKLRIYYKIGEIVSPRNSIIVNATVVENVTTGVGIEMTHYEFAFRNLQVYEFITGEEIGGVPTPVHVQRKN